MKQEYTKPTNSGSQRITSTGHLLAGISNSKHYEAAPSTPLLNDIDSSLTERNYQYIIKSELIPPVAAGQETNKSNGGDRMDEGVKMMIERLDRDSREREERYHNDAQEREKRYREELKEREERIIRIVQDSTVRLSGEIVAIKDSVKKSEDSIDTSSKHIQNISLAMIIGLLAIFVSIALGIFGALITLKGASSPSSNTTTTTTTPPAISAPK